MVAIAIWNRFLAGHSVLDSRFLIRHPPLKQEVTHLLVAKQEFHIFHLARFCVGKMINYSQKMTQSSYNYKIHTDCGLERNMATMCLGLRSEMNGTVFPSLILDVFNFMLRYSYTLQPQTMS
jgi:hypothetical protein